MSGYSSQEHFKDLPYEAPQSLWAVSLYVEPKALPPCKLCSQFNLSVHLNSLTSALALWVGLIEQERWHRSVKSCQAMVTKSPKSLRIWIVSFSVQLWVFWFHSEGEMTWLLKAALDGGWLSTCSSLSGFFLGHLVWRFLSTWTLAHFSRCSPENCCEAIGFEAAFYSLNNFPVGRIVLFFFSIVGIGVCVCKHLHIYIWNKVSLCNLGWPRTCCVA